MERLSKKIYKNYDLTWAVSKTCGFFFVFFLSCSFMQIAVAGKVLESLFLNTVLGLLKYLKKTWFAHDIYFHFYSLHQGVIQV